MGGALSASTVSGVAPQVDSRPNAPSGSWKPVLTLLLLAPAIGELLSGSSPPLQFFNPIAFLLLVALYGCGALLIRETVAQYRLNATGLLLLGAAYGILEEGLTCKSFFNPNWTDTGFLSIYGRAWGVNWVWSVGLTVYHMVVSITVPVFLTEALFSDRSQSPWLRRRGKVTAGIALAFVTLLGFWAFDNRQFHLTEIKEPLLLAGRWNKPSGPLEEFVASQLNSKNREVIRTSVEARTDSPALRHALQDELNRLLPHGDLYRADRFADVALTDQLKSHTTTVPRGDELIVFNRSLLECAYPLNLAKRSVYPFRPPWWWTAASALTIVMLVLLALQHRLNCELRKPAARPWLAGLSFTAAFVVIGFVLPGLVEHGPRIPWLVDCVLWAVVAVFLARYLRSIDGAADYVWRRGLWAIGVLTPWVFFALLLGVFVGMTGAKSFSGMTVVALAFGLAILKLGMTWKGRLAGVNIKTTSSEAATPQGPRS